MANCEVEERGEELTPKFKLGKLYVTRGALRAFEEANVAFMDLVERHAQGDWGDVSQADREENERSMAEGWRILSSYRIDANTRVWIITEADRSATTLLLPEEY